jgi:hypothetical protein
MEEACVLVRGVSEYRGQNDALTGAVRLYGTATGRLSETMSVNDRILDENDLH